MASPADLHATQVRLSTAASRLALREWAKIKTVDDYAAISPRLSLIVTAAQVGAARTAAALMVDTIGEGVAEVSPAAFAGVASDGRSLDGLLQSPVVHARQLYGSGRTDEEIMRAAGSRLSMIVHTQVTDAWRSASQVAITATPRAAWLRVVHPPCCQNCAILAGRIYRWSDGFERHPRCDCVHVPTIDGRTPDGYVADIDVSQIKDLTDAQRMAIVDGADLSQVVNAYRGDYSSAAREKRMTTAEGTTKRGWRSYVEREVAQMRGEEMRWSETAVGRRGAVADYVVRRSSIRPTPEAIYRYTSSREEAVRLLHRHGYIVGDLNTVALRALA